VPNFGGILRKTELYQITTQSKYFFLLFYGTVFKVFKKCCNKYIDLMVYGYVGKNITKCGIVPKFCSNNWENLMSGQPRNAAWTVNCFLFTYFQLEISK
jgi:hypothetical protein